MPSCNHLDFNGTSTDLALRRYQILGKIWFLEEIIAFLVEIRLFFMGSLY